ncbi:MAG: TetR/AcrR family transcriptional regulator [Myxococcales bacterium FL481]|nr:MAG: TetR/AcrR family transcriptional regulator [Myxococcales bacterium FL481]
MRPRTFSDDDLLRAARRCFLAYGPSVSTSHIAAELGVSQAALFKRMGTKRELLLRSLGPPAQPDWLEHAERGPDDRPAAEQLRELVVRADGFFTELIPCLAVLKSAQFDMEEIFEQFTEPPPARAHRVVTAWFRAVGDKGLAYVPSPSAAAGALLGALQSRHMLRHILGDAAPPTSPDYLDEITALISRGIELRPAKREQ